MRVEAGDLVLADANGVVFVPARYAKKVLDVAEEIVSAEKAMAEAIESGSAVSDVMGQTYEQMTQSN